MKQLNVKALEKVKHEDADVLMTRCYPSSFCAPISTSCGPTCIPSA